MMGTCLAIAYTWICKQQQDIQSLDHIHQPIPVIDNVTVVVRESKSHSIPNNMVSYRTPMVVAEKVEPQQVKTSSSGAIASCLVPSEGGVSDAESVAGQQSAVDYDSLFRQVMSEQLDMG
jgi:hypothetical protein